MQIDFFTDLDRTLIYSHRVHLKVPKVLVERFRGRDQSYMTLEAFEFLAQSDNVRLIPVTTRSLEQFGRIELFKEQICSPYALVCNGGQLLFNGVTDPAWLEETRTLYGDQLAMLPEVQSLLKQHVPSEHIFLPDGLFLYAAVEDPCEIEHKLARPVASLGFRVMHDARKVFFVPAGMDKGAALRRFEQRFGKHLSVCAGDSEFDLPMLNEADYAVAPAVLACRVKAKHVIAAPAKSILSDVACDLLKALIARGGLEQSEMRCWPANEQRVGPS